MSLSIRIENLQAKVKRLEAAASKGQKYCAYCRFVTRSSLPDPKKPKPRPEDIIKTKCEFCHSEHITNFAVTPEEEREAVRLWYSFTLEDQYTDPRAHALKLWRDHEVEPKKQPRTTAREKARNDRGAGAFDKLVDEMCELFAQKHKRLKAKYGDPFPEHQQLIESVRERARNRARPYVPGRFDLEKEEINHLIRAELEKIIWGETRPQTASALEKIGREIDELT
jgi:hypothetical protein